MSEELKSLVELKILQFLKGQTLEKNKFEMKSKWYDLNGKTKKNEKNESVRNKEYYEFLKDCTSIVNSFGDEDGFIVIGIDEKKRALIDSPIEQSGLDDSAKVKDIIIGNVDQAFAIDIDYILLEEKRIAVIHLPRSSNKPHAITEYYSQNGQLFRNEIFYRSGSSTEIASKSALDLMYWERRNIVLDKQIEVAFNLSDLNFNISSNSYFDIICNFSIENIGTRNLLIAGFTLTIIVRDFSLTFNYNLPDLIRLAPNDPKVTRFSGQAFVNLNREHGEELLAELKSNRKLIKFDSFTTRLTNHEKLLSIPIVK